MITFVAKPPKNVMVIVVKLTINEGMTIRESWPFSLNDLVSSGPTPDFLVALEEQYVRLLDMLRNDKLREIVVLRIEGYTVAEIAQKMKIGHAGGRAEAAVNSRLNGNTSFSNRIVGNET